MSKGNKIAVKDYLDGDEFDLSLQSLTNATLPVKEIAAIKKGKKLDLSKNQIVTLPDNFVSSFGHLVKLDLSANGLTQLPDNFGNLSLLQHLDLFNNKLDKLPIGFYKLKLLKWLDLKENPLEYPSQEIVGLCRNDNECKSCAVQVLDFMRKENNDKERQRQKELEIKRAKKEALKRELKRLEEMENQEKRRIKQEEKAKEKAKRKAEFERKQKEQKELQKHQASPSSHLKSSTSPGSTSSSLPDLRTLSLVAGLVMLLVGLGLATVIKPDLGEHYAGFKVVTSEVITTMEHAVNPIISAVNNELATHAPNLRKSIVSTCELMGEMLVICVDTLKLGYDLALQELSSVATYIQKS